MDAVVRPEARTRRIIHAFCGPRRAYQRDGYRTGFSGKVDVTDLRSRGLRSGGSGVIAANEMELMSMAVGPAKAQAHGEVRV